MGAKHGGGDSRPPGMTDVARVAGVSAQTVSRTLSGHPNVRKATRDKVMAAVEQLGYRKNSAAQVLSSGRSRTIGVVTLQTAFYSRLTLTAGIEAAARGVGYSVSTASVASLDTSAVEEALSRLADQHVEGVILAIPMLHASTRVERMTRALPTVTINESRLEAAEVVAIDQTQAARLATRHLLDLGHRTVWHVAGPREWRDASDREQGWRETLEAEGRTVPPVLEGDWTPFSGYRSGMLLGRIPEATAVFVSSDEMAFGVIRALHELGRRVPDDISVVGLDDIALAEFCSPSLTTVAQPFSNMGALAVTHLMRHITDPAAVPKPVSVEPSLVIRNSTAPLSSDPAAAP